MEAILTSKGQMTLPKALRDDLNLKPGDKVMFVRSAAGDYSLFPRNGDIRTLKGIIKHKGKPVTLEDMEAAIAENAGKMP